ncbi:hypothetical protein B0H17DRAFT_1216383 [Mycena rosella]|uniref:Uncharacterized protein n=1 Tax=Mycena rosella TaxID=1033263 RepID=A0AAD7C9L8_MYCRO|nr:hypothetical protein B0H17DRAFT_1216383 [Mycena rosella]
MLLRHIRARPALLSYAAGAQATSSRIEPPRRIPALLPPTQLNLPFSTCSAHPLTLAPTDPSLHGRMRALTPSQRTVLKACAKVVIQGRVEERIFVFGEFLS